MWAELTGPAIPSVELVRATTAFGDPQYSKVVQDDPPPPHQVPPPPVVKKK